MKTRKRCPSCKFDRTYEGSLCPVCVSAGLGYSKSKKFERDMKKIRKTNEVLLELENAVMTILETTWDYDERKTCAPKESIRKRLCKALIAYQQILKDGDI